MGTYNGHIIIVLCYEYRTKFWIFLLKYQLLYTLLITMWYLLLILCWHLGHIKEINLTKFQFFLIVKYKEYHFLLKLQNVFIPSLNNCKYNFIAQNFSRKSNIGKLSIRSKECYILPINIIYLKHYLFRKL